MGPFQAYALYPPRTRRRTNMDLSACAFPGMKPRGDGANAGREASRMLQLEPCFERRPPRPLWGYQLQPVAIGPPPFHPPAIGGAILPFSSIPFFRTSPTAATSMLALRGRPRQIASCKICCLATMMLRDTKTQT